MWTLTRTWSDQEMQRKALWVAGMMDAAPPTAVKLRITAQAIVAQSALETGWGGHVVGRHNLFGIKADAGWKGDRVLVHTREVINGQSVMVDDWFRDYSDFGGSIADHFDFLLANGRYLSAGVFAGMGDKSYFQALQAAGYATDPYYAMQCLAVLDTVNNYFLPGMTDQAAALAARPVTVLPTPSAHRWLMIGLRGSDVLDLQRRLGFTRPGDLDGWFGKDTKAAVMRFQNDNHLSDVDGVVGDKTWAALDRAA